MYGRFLHNLIKRMPHSCNPPKNKEKPKRLGKDAGFSTI